MERDLSQIITLKDSAAVTSTEETQTSLSLQISNLSNHKRALEDSIKESLTLLTENRNQGAQRVQASQQVSNKVDKSASDALNDSSPSLKESTERLVSVSLKSL